MNGIGDTSPLELAGLIAGLIGGLRILERTIDGVVLRRRNGNNGAANVVRGDMLIALRDQTQAIRELSDFMREHVQQASRGAAQLESIFRLLAAHDEAARRNWERGG